MSYSKRLLMLVGLVIAVLAISLGGCAPTSVKNADAQAFTDLPEAQTDTGSDAGFLFDLSQKKSCSTDDAYRGMLFFLDGTDTSSNFQERTARLAMHKVIKENWQHNPQETITNGKVAYMLARALGVRGGVMYNLTDASERYSLRELGYKGIIKNRSQGKKISGAEYVGILGRADDYREKVSQ